MHCVSPCGCIQPTALKSCCTLGTQACSPHSSPTALTGRSQTQERSPRFLPPCVLVKLQLPAYRRNYAKLRTSLVSLGMGLIESCHGIVTCPVLSDIPDYSYQEYLSLCHIHDDEITRQQHGGKINAQSTKKLATWCQNRQPMMELAKRRE